LLFMRTIFFSEEVLIYILISDQQNFTVVFL